MRPIGFFDSGLGGISVLRETVRLLPHEDYLYFGDSLNAPYGVKPAGEVQKLCCAAVSRLVSQGAKALVIACNTATSAAIALLRETYPGIPVIGTEPAVKPAVERHPGGRILVMATATTLKEQKFQALREQYGSEAEIIPVPCSGLMEFVEQGVLRGPEVERYLFDKLDPYMMVPVDAVVLGCTHYPFLTGAIRRVVGRSPEILDGSLGVAQQLERQLAERGLLETRQTPGSVEFENSLDGPEILELSRRLFEYKEETE
jgi:glutamate racemase